MRYLPFLDGKYSTAPGLLWMKKAIAEKDRLVFQIDETYDRYLENKKACRQENLNKYYTRSRFVPATERAVNQYLVNQLTQEYPGQFIFKPASDFYYLRNQYTGEELTWAEDWQAVTQNTYQDLFDGLCGQVPEDIAVCQLEQNQDWLAALHLCAPNHWAAQDKIGKPFNVVHGPVPGLDQMMRHYFKMLESLVQKGPFTRFAWGIATDNRLNHHPKAPPGWNATDWQGRAIGLHHPELYIRVERQNLIGLLAVNAFIFTIRTYFYSVADLTRPEQKALLAAVESMSEKALAYKGLTGKVGYLQELLQ
jgi:dimethylamine monooxygenase subunit A